MSCQFLVTNSCFPFFITCLFVFSDPFLVICCTPANIYHLTNWVALNCRWSQRTSIESSYTFTFRQPNWEIMQEMRAGLCQISDPSNTRFCRSYISHNLMKFTARKRVGVSKWAEFWWSRSSVCCASLFNSRSQTISCMKYFTAVLYGFVTCVPFQARDSRIVADARHFKEITISTKKWKKEEITMFIWNLDLFQLLNFCLCSFG